MGIPRTFVSILIEEGLRRPFSGRVLQWGKQKIFIDDQKLTDKSPSNEAGLSFRIQIGGFKKRDLSSYDDPEGELVKVEANSKGTQEITLGRFTSYKKADQFKKHLRAMGLKDSWIVPYKDGQRVPLEDVVDELDIPKP